MSLGKRRANTQFGHKQCVPFLSKLENRFKGKIFQLVFRSLTTVGLVKKKLKKAPTTHDERRAVKRVSFVQRGTLFCKLISK